MPREPRLPTHLTSRRVLSANVQAIPGALAHSQAQGLWGSSLVSIIGGFRTFNPKMLSTWDASKHPRGESQLPALRETQARLGGHETPCSGPEGHAQSHLGWEGGGRKPSVLACFSYFLVGTTGLGPAGSVAFGWGTQECQGASEAS